MIDSWKRLRRVAKTQINVYKQNAIKEISKNLRIRVQTEEKRIKTKKKLSFREKSLKIKEKKSKRSLTKIKYLWHRNLEEMEKSLKDIKANRLKAVSNIKTLTEYFISKSKANSLSRQLKCNEENVKIIKHNHYSKEIMSNEPSVIISHSNNDSLEFEKCMAELDKLHVPVPDNQENISINKSFGGWKSEFESENESILQINSNEIKSAINILKKANLLNSQNRNILGKLSEVILKPENSYNSELIFQLLNLKKNPKYSPPISIQKPPLGTSKYNHIQDDLACTNPKGNFFLPDDIDMGRTILSSENPITARHDEIQENFLEALINSAQNFNDVQLEDLLNMPGIKFDDTEVIIDKPITRNCEIQKANLMKKEFFNEIESLSHSEVKVSPVKKNIQGMTECFSTGISSHTGLRSRITIKTAGSEFSQKAFTPDSKGIEKSFNYL